MTEPAPDGAWGIRVPSLAPDAVVLSRAPAHWPSVDVAVSVRADHQTPALTPDHARYDLLGGHQIAVRRDPPTVRLWLRAPTPRECVIQPHLSSAASTFAVWGGRQALHAGAFVHAGGAWVLLGDKGMGKSTTLGWLARAGIPVMTDDLVVHDHGMICAGPRCVDLRPDAARRLGVGRDLGVVGTRERWRVDLPHGDAEAPLRGFVFLGWGGRARIEPVPPVQRLTRLGEHRALALPWTDPEVLLELAGRPGVSWHRPRAWDRMDASVAELLGRLGETGASSG